MSIEEIKAIVPDIDSYYEIVDGAKHAFILQNYQSSDEEITEYMGIIDDYFRERKI